MKRILIVKLWAIGDILMATPLLRALKADYPDCSISWLVDSSYSGAIEDNALIDEVIAFDSAPWRRDFRYGKLISYIATSLKFRRELLARRFDLVISLTPDKWWCLWFKAASTSIGLFPSSTPGFLRNFYTYVIPVPPGTKDHNTDHYLRPMKVLGNPGPYDRRMVYTVTEENDQFVAQFLAGNPSFNLSEPFIVLHPGTSQKTKCWPIEHYAKLADSLSPEFQVVITGSAAEAGVADKLRSLTIAPKFVVVAAGAFTSFGQSAALVQRAAAVVTGDTSMLHLASVLDTPFVGIYGSTRPNDNAPLFGRNVLLYDDKVPCSPCYKASCSNSGTEYLACQKAITPEAVRQHVRKLIEFDKVGAPEEPAILQ